uniref:Uncharacterized protein n=1 Tax=Chrysotila carterae TaxID=13221 RepID=A0A7S4BM42_CHRCT
MEGEHTLLQAITALKAEGNKHYAAGEYQEAAAVYSKAVRQLPDPEEDDVPPALASQAAVILCNRSATYMHLKKAVAALADAQLAADFDAANWKAHWRTGLALMMMEPRLERSEQAVAAFKRTQDCTTLPESERQNVSQALARAQYRLEQGRDALDMPDMANCVLC